MFSLNQVHEVHFRSVDEIFQYATSHLITRNHNFGFRGHEDAGWKLEPTLIRFTDLIKDAYPEYANDRHIIMKVLPRLHDEFRRNLIINNDLSQDKIDNMDLWQFGQHFGLPSPLLDWTFSPFVALFFSLAATGKQQVNDARCLWVLNIDLIDVINRSVIQEVRPKYIDSIKPERLLSEQFPTLEIIHEINENNKRMAFQQGFFTKHQYYRSLEVWIDRIVEELHFKKSDAPLLQKLTYRCTAKERVAALDKLDHMNINSRTLYPDISGSVKGAVDSTFRSFQEPMGKGFAFSI